MFLKIIHKEKLMSIINFTNYEQYLIDTLQEFDNVRPGLDLCSRFEHQFINEEDKKKKFLSAVKSLLENNIIREQGNLLILNKATLDQMVAGNW